MIKISRSGGKYLIGTGIILVIGFLMTYLLTEHGFPSQDFVVPTYTGIQTLNLKDNSPRHNVDTTIFVSLPVQINAIENFTDYVKRFYVDKDTFVRISAVGEAADYKTNSFLFRPWDNDGVEFFFKLKNNKTSIFDVNDGDYQFRILWKSLKIDGQNHSVQGLKVSEKDPSNERYVMQITIPWKLLGGTIPHPFLKIGFDATIIDCDGGSEKAKIDWNNKIDNDWINTESYGIMILSGQKNFEVDSSTVVATPKNSVGPGKSKQYYSYKNLTLGYLNDTLDLSGKFKAEWDQHNLYIDVLVNDNIKTLAHAMFDYGWIEDDKGKRIWQMSIDHLKHAGGAVKNKSVSETVLLKKGKYVLKFHTDESHSPTKWDSDPPNGNLYGIKVAGFNNK